MQTRMKKKRAALLRTKSILSSPTTPDGQPPAASLVFSSVSKTRQLQLDFSTHQRQRLLQQWRRQEHHSSVYHGTALSTLLTRPSPAVLRYPNVFAHHARSPAHPSRAPGTPIHSYTKSFTGRLPRETMPTRSLSPGLQDYQGHPPQHGCST